MEFLTGNEILYQKWKWNYLQKIESLTGKEFLDYRVYNITLTISK